MDTVGRRAAVKLPRHARVYSAFGYLTHNQLPDTLHHMLLYSAPGVGRLNPHIMAHIFTIY